MLFRLSTGHIQLWLHLHWLQVVDFPQCNHCNGGFETIEHYRLKCTHYASKHHKHLASWGHKFLHLSFLLFATHALGPLFDYIKATSHFSDSNR
jgi:hypothetical protein